MHALAPLPRIERRPRGLEDRGANPITPEGRKSGLALGHEMPVFGPLNTRNARRMCGYGTYYVHTWYVLCAGVVRTPIPVAARPGFEPGLEASKAPVLTVTPSGYDGRWSAWRDFNPRPPVPETGALDRLSYTLKLKLQWRGICSRLPAYRMNIQRKTRFRLIAPLPLEVVFPSITYRLRINQVPISGTWQCEAEGPNGHYICAFQGSEERLRRDLFEDGIEISNTTVLHVIFRRLVQDARAELVTPLNGGPCRVRGGDGRIMGPGLLPLS